MPIHLVPGLILCAAACLSAVASADDAPSLERDILPLFKAHCVKCHGPIKHEARLILSSAGGVAIGGKGGAAIDRAAPLESLLWRRIEGDEMPPDAPLPAAERATVRRWLAAGAAGLPAVSAASTEHWAFQRLAAPRSSMVNDATNVETAVDRFLQSALEARQLAFSPVADRYTLIRRLSFDLTGLPPSPEEIESFVQDLRADAYQRLAERYLASPHYGERWARHWLDAAGYADSNGYFSADSDRPLAYRYRDYVVASLNADKPFDQFLREQLAGDELVGFRPGAEIRPEQIEPLIATHFLRNSQDGTGESDGNPDEVRADRYSVLEGTQQIIGSALLGLTLQCARCHDHKFEPVTQAEYYKLQAILAPAFDPENWVKPNDRQVVTALAGETTSWERRMRQIDESVVSLRREFTAWVKGNRPRGRVLFEDHFETHDEFAFKWSNQAPGDDAPGGSTPVVIGASTAPAALVRNGTLNLIESGGAGNRWLSTAESFDWAPSEPGDIIQVSFDLVADKVQASDAPAARIGYYVALCDYDDSSGRSGGNILIDGNPAGGAAVHVDYPGDDSRAAGTIGTTGYLPGHNYGLRITNSGDGGYLLQQLVDELPEEKTVTLSKADLPPGGFGFEFCCGRGFIVDNVVIERSTPAERSTPVVTNYSKVNQQKRQEIDAAR